MNNRILLLIVALVGCILNGWDHVDRTDALFVYTKGRNDTLIMRSDHTYLRRVKVGSRLLEDKGTWLYDDGDLWFNNWVCRGEYSFGPYGEKSSSVSPSFRKGLDGHIRKIIFDVDDYYYYEYVRNN